MSSTPDQTESDVKFYIYVSAFTLSIVPVLESFTCDLLAPQSNYIRFLYLIRIVLLHNLFSLLSALIDSLSNYIITSRFSICQTKNAEP